MGQVNCDCLGEDEAFKNQIHDSKFVGFQEKAVSEARLADLKEQWNINPKVLGQGAFGKVYSASNKKDPSYKVAIKIIDKKQLDQFAIKCLKNEVEIMLKVDHPNIAKYFETYDEPQYIYMVMELLSGGEMYDKILDASEPMSEKDAS